MTQAGFVTSSPKLLDSINMKQEAGSRKPGCSIEAWQEMFGTKQLLGIQSYINLIQNLDLVSKHKQAQGLDTSVLKYVLP